MSVEGLELRKQALEVLGWRYSQTYCFSLTGGWHHPKCTCADSPDMDNCRCYNEARDSDSDGCNLAECVHFHDECSRAPAIESDPSTSEFLFMAWLQQAPFATEVYAALSMFDDGSCSLELIEADSGNSVAHVEASTPSEARARAIVAASQMGVSL